MLLQLYLIDNYEIIYLSIYFKMTDENRDFICCFLKYFGYICFSLFFV